MAHNPTLLAEIQESYKNKGRLIPFVGSGFTKNIDDYPDWDEFVDLLKQDLKDKISFDKKAEKAFDELPNNLEKTEYYVRNIGKIKARKSDPNTHEEYMKVYNFGRNELIKKIRYIFRKSKNKFNSSQWSTHLLLLKKFQKMIYTTNWDDTLERIELLDLHGLNSKANYAFSKNGDVDGKPRIIKYHGDFTDDGKHFLVACLTDYQYRMTFSNCLDIKFKSDLLRYDLLLLGYSFTDPNIHLMIHNLSEIIAATNKTVGSNQMNTKIYMVVLEKPDDLRVNLLKDTFSSLRLYHLLGKGDYNRKGLPKQDKAKAKMEQFLNSLTLSF